MSYIGVSYTNTPPNQGHDACDLTALFEVNWLRSAECVQIRFYCWPWCPPLPEPGLGVDAMGAVVGTCEHRDDCPTLTCQPHLVPPLGTESQNLHLLLTKPTAGEQRTADLLLSHNVGRPSHGGFPPQNPNKW